MLRIMLKSKVYYPVVSDAQLYYRGSITIDEKIMQEAGLREHEKVEVLNVNTGARFETYVIKGKKNSGIICLNGPAARLGYKGDKLVILCYALYSETELNQHKTQFVEVDESNRIKNTYLAG